MYGAGVMKKKLGLYIHIPFCMKKCAYCDFLSFSGSEDKIADYVEGLIKEIIFWGKTCVSSNGKSVVDTIYFGGGTPSSISPFYIEEIMKTICQRFEVQEDAEITIECNPGTMTAEKCDSYRRAGVNRISLGLQSADNRELMCLGRIHTYEEFLESYHMVRRAGFQNVSVDIMSALPGQTLASYRKTLERVLALEPEHISSYSLIVEEGTLFHKWQEEKRLELPDEDTEREMYYLTDKMLCRAGYHRYEISNYARPGRESRHNSSYWTGDNYLGFGLGASSFYENVRFQNEENLEEYINIRRNTPLEKLEERWSVQWKKHRENDRLSKKELMEEFMFLGLRRMEGISVSDFEERFGEHFDKIYGEVCGKLERDGLIIRKDDRIALTRIGIDVSNQVMAAFLMDE